MKKEGGVTCTCGKFSKFPAYVYAHWSDELIYRCECGQEWLVLSGSWTQHPKQRRKRRKDKAA